MNPYEPPPQKREKYKEPLVDWWGFWYVVLVLIVIPIGFFWLIGFSLEKIAETLYW